MHKNSSRKIDGNQRCGLFRHEVVGTKREGDTDHIPTTAARHGVPHGHHHPYPWPRGKGVLVASNVGGVQSPEGLDGSGGAAAGRCAAPRRRGDCKGYHVTEYRTVIMTQAPLQIARGACVHRGRRLEAAPEPGSTSPQRLQCTSAGLHLAVRSPSAEGSGKPVRLWNGVRHPWPIRCIIRTIL
uniref:Uncharacterized protein n=1 Tax=Eutreptiella gymnastica TaxID=73025 RepID=A0A7S4LBJ8_9EUGL